MTHSKIVQIFSQCDVWCFAQTIPGCFFWAGKYVQCLHCVLQHAPHKSTHMSNPKVTLYYVNWQRNLNGCWSLQVVNTINLVFNGLYTEWAALFQGQ